VLVVAGEQRERVDVVGGALVHESPPPRDLEFLVVEPTLSRGAAAEAAALAEHGRLERAARVRSRAVTGLRELERLMYCTAAPTH